MIYYLLLTSLTVSIDSFFCGFSLSFLSGKKKYIVLIITLTVFAMCLFANYSVKILQISDEKTSKTIGGLILIAIGLYNLKKHDAEVMNKSKSLIKQSFLIGFAVGIDGAFANFSLSLMGINQFYVPLLIALMHGALILLGITFRNSKLGKKLEKISFFPPLILITLGVYKIVTLFI